MADDVSSVTSTSESLNSLYSATGSNDLGKDEFLQLLVAQLEYQDPLDPMDNTAFVAQLAEFSQLEQLYNANDTLGDNVDVLTSVNNAMMINMVGKNVKYSSDSLYWSGSTLPEITYDVPINGDVTISIMDEAGSLVYQTQETQDEGENTFQWDGIDSNGNESTYGNYYFTVVYSDSQGQQTILSPYLDGKVTAIQFEDGSTVLYSGDQKVDPSYILAIYNDDTSSE